MPDHAVSSAAPPAPHPAADVNVEQAASLLRSAAGVVVIVLNWNGTAVIRACLDGLRGQSFRDFAVLVVDNHSADDSPAIIRAEYPEMELLELSDNHGFARGNNLGIAHVWATRPATRYIALLNNDTLPQPGWLAVLVAALEQRPEMGMAASKILCWDGASQPERIDTAGDMFFQHGAAGKRGHGEPADCYGTPEEVFGACAGAALYRCEMLREIGLLDEEFFAYNEDVDLDFRARLAGWRCWYAPAAVVWHRVSYSAQAYSERVVYWSKRNSAWVLVKNWPARFFLRYALPLLGYNFLSDLRWIFGGRAKAVLRGRWHAVLGLRRMLRKRAVILAARKITDKELDRWIVRRTPWCEATRRALRRYC